MIKEKAIIFDLDGTVCDDSHRQPLLTNNDPITPELWNEYHSGCVYDEPIDIVCISLVGADRLGYKIIVVTGRDEQYRNITENWLLRFNIPVDHLYMRPDGHHVSSVDFKRRVYLDEIEPFYEVMGVFEDRKCVVDMWRELGLICLQTKEGNY